MFYVVYDQFRFLLVWSWIDIGLLWDCFWSFVVDVVFLSLFFGRTGSLCCFLRKCFEAAYVAFGRLRLLFSKLVRLFQLLSGRSSCVGCFRLLYFVFGCSMMFSTFLLS